MNDFKSVVSSKGTYSIGQSTDLEHNVRIAYVGQDGYSDAVDFPKELLKELVKDKSESTSLLKGKFNVGESLTGTQKTGVGCLIGASISALTGIGTGVAGALLVNTTGCSTAGSVLTYVTLGANPVTFGFLAAGVGLLYLGGSGAPAPELVS